MKSRLLYWQICLVALLALSSLSGCLAHKPAIQQTMVAPTSRESKSTPSLTETPDLVLTTFANSPTRVLFPMSTALTVSTPTRQQVERFEYPVLLFGGKGADVDYTTVSHTSKYLWIWGCAGTDLQDLEKNVIQMQARLLVNGQAVDETKMVQFDRAPRPDEIDRTWAILFSGWQINRTTKFELRYSLSQTSNVNGIYGNKGSYYSIVYVNAQ